MFIYIIVGIIPKKSNYSNLFHIACQKGTQKGKYSNRKIEKQENREIEKQKLHKFKKKQRNRELHKLQKIRERREIEKQRNRELHKFQKNRVIEKQKNRIVEKQIESKNRYSLFCIFSSEFPSIRRYKVSTIISDIYR